MKLIKAYYIDHEYDSNEVQYFNEYDLELVNDPTGTGHIELIKTEVIDVNEDEATELFASNSF